MKTNMATFQKIPQKIKAIGSIAIGRYAIFCNGLLKAGEVCSLLEKQDEKKGIPVVGYVTHRGEKIFYCRYGFINDPDVYSKK